MPSRKIVGRKLHGGFGIRVTFDAAVHARVQFRNLAGHAPMTAGARWRVMTSMVVCRALAEIAAEIAAPILEGRRLAPSGAAISIGHLHQHIATDRLGQPGPFVLTPRRQCDVMQLDLCNRCVGHVPSQFAEEGRGTCEARDRIGMDADWQTSPFSRRT